MKAGTVSPVSVCRYCDYKARWEGLCLTCYQRSGLAEQRREEQLAREAAERTAQAEADAEAAHRMLMDMGDRQLPWWEISERLNKAGHRNHGHPWTPTSARGVYVASNDDWS